MLGDTNSALCAIPAKRLKIPIFHMEAGNRCFDQNVPEEINRRIVDHVSDVNLPYTEHSRRYLLSEGIRKEHVFVTGSPMAEVLQHYRSGIDGSKVLSELGLEKGKYIVVSAHREENLDIDAHLESLVGSLDAVAREFKNSHGLLHPPPGACALEAQEGEAAPARPVAAALRLLRLQPASAGLALRALRQRNALRGVGHARGSRPSSSGPAPSAPRCSTRAPSSSAASRPPGGSTATAGSRARCSTPSPARPCRPTTSTRTSRPRS